MAINFFTVYKDFALYNSAKFFKSTLLLSVIHTYESNQTFPKLWLFFQCTKNVKKCHLCSYFMSKKLSTSSYRRIQKSFLFWPIIQIERKIGCFRFDRIIILESSIVTNLIFLPHSLLKYKKTEFIVSKSLKSFLVKILG